MPESRDLFFAKIPLEIQFKLRAFPLVLERLDLHYGKPTISPDYYPLAIQMFFDGQKVFQSYNDECLFDAREKVPAPWLTEIYWDDELVALFTTDEQGKNKLIFDRLPEESVFYQLN